MLQVSPLMEQYLAVLQNGLEEAMAVARAARAQGLDPKTVPEIPVANDLADRVEALLNIRGVAARIRELEATMSREEVALRIGDDFVACKFGETGPLEVLDHAIRTAMALLTEGVVAAPTEGIAKIGLGKNDDGTEYLKIYYAGPIRSAGVLHRHYQSSSGTMCGERSVLTGISRDRRRLSGTSRRSASITLS